MLKSKLDELDSSSQSQQSPQELALYLEKSINAVSEKFIPIKQICKHSKPFWNPTLTTLSKDLRAAQKAFLTRSTPRNKDLLDRSKAKFREALVKEKNKWIHKKLEGLNINQSQEFWKQYSRYFKPKEDSIIGNLICASSNSLKSSDEDKEELLFKTFFCGDHLENRSFDEDHLSEIQKELDSLITRDFDVPIGSQNNEDLITDFNRKITRSDVIDAIKRQKSAGKSIDGTKIHPVMLKHLPPAGIDFLVILFDMVLDSGDWLWFKSFITFIRKEKKPSYTCPGAYRPISLLSYIGKIFERILEERILQFCQIDGTIDDAQEGFLPSRNTSRYLYKWYLAYTKPKGESSHHSYYS